MRYLRCAHVLVVIALGGSVACGPKCGKGTKEKAGVCTPDDAPADAEADTLVKDASKLGEDVTATKKKAEEILLVANEVVAALKQRKYPAESLTKLKDFTVPFGDATMKSVNASALPAETRNRVMLFWRLSDSLGQEVKNLATVLEYTKPKLEEAWAKWSEKPAPEYAVIFTQSGEGKVAAELWVLAYDDRPGARAPRWRLEDSAWPSDVALRRPQEKETHKVSRYLKGELPGDNPQFVPIDPRTTAPFDLEQAIQVPFLQALVRIRELVSGDDRPGFERPGITPEAEKLSPRLSNITSLK